jgi:hypothetical protein
MAKGKSLSKWMRLLLGRIEALGYSPSKPQFALVVVVPPPPPPPTAEGEGGEEGVKCFLDATANTVELIFCIMDRNFIFVVTLVMDG